MSTPAYNKGNMGRNRQSIFEALSRVRNLGHWGEACRNIGSSYDENLLSLLMISLKEQDKDCPAEMQKILGEEYDNIIYS